MDEHDLGPSEREALSAWQAEAPPPDFSARVLASMHEASRVKPVRERRVALLAGAVLVAACALLFVWRGREHQGTLSATARTSLDIGDRGVAVAEEGALLRYRVQRSGEARVEQERGSVFYRVERGGPFRVHTPLGSVEVLGTCFRVEVVPMKWGKEHLVSAAGAAALSAALVVTVYEGRVAVASADHRKVLAAGERAYADGKGGLEVLDAVSLEAAREAEALSRAELENGSPELLRRHVERLQELLATERGQLSRAREEAESLKAELAEAQKPAGEAATKAEDTFFDPSPEELRERLESCTLKMDLPPVLGSELSTVGDETIKSLGLSPEEAAAMNRAIAQLHGEFGKEMRALYVEATGDEAGARTLSPTTMLREVAEKSPEGESASVRVKLLREQLGEAAPPADLSQTAPVERAWRRMAALGDEFEEKLAGSIGSERAHELRAKRGGWPFSRWSEGGCAVER